MRSLIALITVLLLWIGVHCTNANPLQSSVVIIVRHAEKPDTGDGLAPAGDARANAYVDYFKHFTVNSNAVILTTYLQRRTLERVSVPG